MGTNKNRHVVKITVLLISVFGGLTALSVGLVLLISAYTSLTGTRNLMRSRAMLTIDALEHSIEQHLSPALSLINHISGLVENDDLELTDKPTLISTLKGSLAAAPQISGVVVWTKSMSQIRIVRKDKRAPVVMSAFQPKDTGIADFLKKIIQQKKPVWNSPYREAGKTYILVFAPLYHNGEYQGVIGTGISIRELSKYVSTLGKELNMTAFILYGKDRILAHPALSGAKKRKLYTKGEALLPLAKLNDPVLLKLKNTAPRRLLKRYNFNSYRIKAGKTTYLALLRTLKAYGKTPWQIGIYGPQAALTSEIARLFNSIMIGALLMLVSILAAIFLARRIAAPIKEIASAAEQIGKFELTDITPLRPSRITELNNQSRAFNQMLEGLKSFQTYVPQRLVKRLISEGSGHDVTSREAELTVMFTDIVGFTTLSEHLSPTEIAEMLNAHFELINACIEESGGTLDKYIGDAVMAFWGAPERQNDHAVRAAHAALCIARKMENQPRDTRWPNLRIKIAIHTGPLIVGNIGATSRMNYTIIGDTVNTCARIEKLCGKLDNGARVNILLSDETARLITDNFKVSRVGEYPVKGRSQPVNLWRLDAAAPGQGALPAC
jgi:adenylate cyclase